MECKKCGIELSGRESKTVAQWTFCPECFQALMERTEAKKEETVKTPAPETAREEQACQVCERKVAKGESHEMLGLVFCLPCYENLVKRPYIPPTFDIGDQEAPIDPMGKPAVEQVDLDFISTIHCYGCGREIPAISSKQFNGYPYCPDCYYALPEEETSKPETFPALAPEHQKREKKEDVEDREQQAGMRCQTCQRQVLSENLKTVEGFEICLACLTTNRDMALEIARHRHRKILEILKEELGL